MIQADLTYINEVCKIKIFEPNIFRASPRAFCFNNLETIS